MMRMFCRGRMDAHDSGHSNLLIWVPIQTFGYQYSPFITQVLFIFGKTLAEPLHVFFLLSLFFIPSTLAGIKVRFHAGCLSYRYGNFLGARAREYARPPAVHYDTANAGFSVQVQAGCQDSFRLEKIPNAKGHGNRKQLKAISSCISKKSNQRLSCISRGQSNDHSVSLIVKKGYFSLTSIILRASRHDLRLSHRGGE